MINARAFLFGTALVVVACFPASSLAEDFSALTQGVQLVTSWPGVPGPISPGAGWTTIASCPYYELNGHHTPAVLAAARSYGSGRVFAIGHEGYFTSGDLLRSGYDNERFGRNVVKWLDKGNSKVICVRQTEWSGGVESAFVSRLASVYRYQVRTVAQEEELTPSDLQGCGVLLYIVRWAPISSDEVNAVVNFVNSGGGAWLGGLGWSYVGYVNPNLDLYPMNQIGSRFGVRWIDGRMNDDDPHYYVNNCTCHPVIHMWYSGPSISGKISLRDRSGRLLTDKSKIPPAVILRLWADDSAEYDWPASPVYDKRTVVASKGAAEFDFSIPSGTLNDQAYDLEATVYGSDRKISHFDLTGKQARVDMLLTYEKRMNTGQILALGGHSIKYKFVRDRWFDDAARPVSKDVFARERAAIKEAADAWSKTGVVTLAEIGVGVCAGGPDDEKECLGDADCREAYCVGYTTGENPNIRFYKEYTDADLGAYGQSTPPGRSLDLAWRVDFARNGDFGTPPKLNYIPVLLPGGRWAQNWVYTGGGARSMYSAALHEIGHTLGLAGDWNTLGDWLGQQWSIMDYLSCREGATFWYGWSDVETLGKINGVSLTATTTCPVDMILTDSAGNTVSKAINEIADATYVEQDLDGDDDLDDQITIPEPTTGDYSITVIPEPGASPEDKVTLIVEDHGVRRVLLDEVTVADLPTQPMTVVVDRTPPTLVVGATPDALDGCDNGMVAIRCEVVVQDNTDADPQVALGGITVNGDFDDADIQGAEYGTDDREFLLRPVLNPDGTPRRYTARYVAMDATGNRSEAAATIRIEDGTPPTVCCPADTAVECDGARNVTLMDSWLSSASASDDCSEATLVNDYSGLLGTCGATGAATVTWTAADRAGNTASCSATFTIVDTTPPDLECRDVTPAECNSPSGRAMDFASQATDVCDPNVQVTCVDASGIPVESGQVFPIGSTDVTCSAHDPCGNAAEPCMFTVTVHATAPTITQFAAAPLLVPIATPVAFSLMFTDDPGDVDRVTLDFGDQTNAVRDGALSPLALSHTYMVAGIYNAMVTVEDRCGSIVTDSIVIVVYDPAAGFTTGGGWFIPDAASFIDGIGVTDTVSKANFGFVVKYKKGASTPDGNLEFVYKAGDINLKSTTMDWMVVQSATKVRFKGLATINGQGPYTFKVTAEDNGEPGTSDRFQIDIWLGVVDTENGPPTPKHRAKGVLGGGNIRIQK